MLKPDSGGYDTDLILAETRSVTLDANGGGWIRYVGPIQSYERWHVHSVQSIVVGATQQSQLRVFLNGGATAVDSTYDGNLNTSDSEYTLMPGSHLSFQYTAGSPGAIATISISGRRLLRGRLAY